MAHPVTLNSRTFLLFSLSYNPSAWRNILFVGLLLKNMFHTPLQYLHYGSVMYLISYLHEKKIERIDDSLTHSD